jgi:hypothetical protein
MCFVCAAASSILPNILQQTNITPLSQSECSNRIGTVGTIWDNHICVYDSTNASGACKVCFINSALLTVCVQKRTNV